MVCGGGILNRRSNPQRLDSPLAIRPQAILFPRFFMKLPGQPAVAGPLTGILEMVVPSKTGFLAARVSPESLAEALASALAEPDQLREMRERCRKYAEEIWNPEKLMRQFAELARELMAESR